MAFRADIILDSGASANYFQQSSTLYKNATKFTGLQVTLPNGEVINSILKATLNIDHLPAAAKEVYIFKDVDLPNFNLISVSNLTKLGMKVSFDSNHATVVNDTGKIVLHANRDTETNLYYIQDIPRDNQLFVMFPRNSTKNELTSLYISSLGSPTTSTLLKAVTNKWIKLPRLDAKMIRRHPHSIATNKGHLDHTRAGLDTSKQVETYTRQESPHNEDTQPKQTVYVDITGKFSYQSARQAWYVLIMRCSDTNYIHAEPLTSRKATEISRAFTAGLEFFKEKGVVHKHVKMDNETSTIFEDVLRKYNLDIQYVPPDTHRQNPAERDIRTFKNHFISVLATADKDYPINEWDRLIPHAEMTLNLLRGSHLKKELSAWTCLFGEYNFDKNPIAPAGTKVLVHESPDKRASWAPHGVIGFYIGTAMGHYRSYQVLVQGTNRVRISDSVAWHPDSEKNDTREKFSFAEEMGVKNTGPISRKTGPIHRLSAPIVVPVTSPTETPSIDVGQDQTVAPINAVNNAPEQNAKRIESGTPLRVSERSRRQNPKYANNVFRFAGSCLSYRNACKGPEKDLWLKAANEEFDRLITETGTMKFINWDQKPAERKASYYNPQTRIKTKSDGSLEYRVRGTYGGDISDYQGPTSARTADMVTIKILLNAVVSEEAKFMTMDIKDFYLGTPMETKEYMRININQIPIESRRKYVEDNMVKDNHVIAEVSKGIYGLQQAGTLAQQKLFKHLNDHGFIPVSIQTPCLMKHKERNIVFCLVVDDFGVKYKDPDDVKYLSEVLKMEYNIKEDWSGKSYLGYHIEHDELKGRLAISIPNYINDAVKRFNIDVTKKINNPHCAELESREDSDQVTADQKKRVQQIIGVLLYYARAVDSTILTRVNKLASMQANATLSTLKAAERILQYASQYSNATITYFKSDMKLICFSDAAYLNETKSRSRCGGLFYLGDNNNDYRFNGPILSVSSIVDVVVTSAAESEYAATFINGKEALYMREILKSLGYEQQQTPIYTDNSFVHAIANDDCKIKRSKAMDMRFHWVREQIRNKTFNVIWCKGCMNIADHLTKDITTQNLKLIREFLTKQGDKRWLVNELPNVNRSRTSCDKLVSGGCVKTEN